MSGLYADTQFLQKFAKGDGWMSKPFRFQDGKGQWWAGATDGRTLLAVEAESEYERVEDTSAQPARLGDIISLLGAHNNPNAATMEKGRRISIAALSQWCGEPNWQSDLLCTDCGGTKTASCQHCNGTTTGPSRNCPDCGSQHTCRCLKCNNGLVPCPKCEGSGSMSTVVPENLGRIGRIIINREYLARAFAYVTGGTKANRIGALFADTKIFLYAHEKGPPSQPDHLLLIGPDWRMVLVGIRKPDEKDIPRYEYEAVPISPEQDEDCVGDATVDIPF